MTTNTLTLTQFILERIAEDEAECAEMVRLYPGDVQGTFWYGNGDDIDIRVGVARGIATCKAHRAIVEHHAPLPFADDPTKHYCRICDESIGGWFPCDTLRDLASIYADHPAFDSRWAI